jgi:hypothetical protein
MFVLASGYQLLIMYLFACLSYYRSLSDVLKREIGVHGVDGPCLPPIMAPIQHGLSFEILDMIIDEVAVDLLHERDMFPAKYPTDSSREIINTLRACALTSCAMRPRAHHHLYALVKIPNYPRASDISEAFQGRPTLAACVKMLIINTYESERDKVGGLWMYKPSFSAVSFAGLLPLLAHLTWLSFDNVDFSEFAVRSRRKCLDQVVKAIPPSVRKLEFSECIFQDDTMLVKIIAGAANLNSLSLSVKDCAWIDTSKPHSFQPTLSPQTLITIDSTLILRPWTDALSFQSLTNIEFIVLINSDVALWQGVLNSSPLLAKISIRRLKRHRKSLDLCHQRVLETLHVEAPLHSRNVYSYEQPNLAEPSCILLSSARSTKLSSVEIIFDLSIHSEMLHHVRWANVKRVLDDPNITWATVPKLVITLSAGSISLLDNPGAYLKEQWEKVGGAEWIHLNFASNVV